MCMVKWRESGCFGFWSEASGPWLVTIKTRDSHKALDVRLVVEATHAEREERQPSQVDERHKCKQAEYIDM